MGSLLSSLLNSAEALKVYDRQLATVQNNVTNASTPGYVRQNQTIDALPFQLDAGFTGGVRAGLVESARSEYAEEGVRRQSSLLGEAEQKATDLAQLETLFDLSSDYTVPGALSTFFQSFSQLSINPNDTVARQAVIDRASELATAFNQTATGLTDAASEADKQVRSTVDSINDIASRIRDLNAVRRQNFASRSDAGLDAQIHAALEELSTHANITALQQQDGTVSVFLGGQSPLVIGDNQYRIQADFSTPTTRILDTNSNDLTNQVTSGKLAGLLDETNKTIPSYLDDLDLLAATLSDTVNGQLQAGVDASGATPVIDLFSYNATIGEAISLSVTGIQPDQIAAARPTAPGGNGNALDIAAMVDQKILNGFTLTQSFGNLGARVGRDVAAAKEQQQTQKAMVTQSRSMRDQVSAVDLNSEATQLMQIQRAYQATGKLLTVLNDLTETLIGLIR